MQKNSIAISFSFLLAIINFMPAIHFVLNDDVSISIVLDKIENDEKVHEIEIQITSSEILDESSFFLIKKQKQNTQQESFDSLHLDCVYPPPEQLF